MTKVPKKHSQAPCARSVSSILLALAFFIIAVLYLGMLAVRWFTDLDLSGFSAFNTVFISILMQAIPFMLIGVLVSSIMHVFMSDAFIVRIFPTRNGLGFLTALFAGLLFPVCECAIVPVAARLVKKGVAVPIAVTFMLAAPIINPIVIVSTFYAFPGQSEIVLMRLGFGLTIALGVGLALLLFDDKQSVLLPGNEQKAHNLSGENHGGFCCCRTDADDVNTQYRRQIIRYKFRILITHAGEEFFAVGKYLIVGAFITSLFQTLVPREVFADQWAQSGTPLIIMMAMAFLFSACSTSDAFIARSFANRFATGPIMGFLVFGPMMDIKNLLMLLAGFKKSFVIQLVILIVLFNFMAFIFL